MCPPPPGLHLANMAHTSRRRFGPANHAGTERPAAPRKPAMTTVVHVARHLVSAFSAASAPYHPFPPRSRDSTDFDSMASRLTASVATPPAAQRSVLVLLHTLPARQFAAFESPAHRLNLRDLRRRNDNQSPGGSESSPPPWPPRNRPPVGSEGFAPGGMSPPGLQRARCHPSGSTFRLLYQVPFFVS